VLHELAAVKDDVFELQQSIGGALTIDVIPTVDPYFLPPLLGSFSRKFPGVELTVVEEITPIPLERLRAGSSISRSWRCPLAAEFST
jgi:LysR family transcriptional regulator, hydrogen peroxide-inducible genes activator